MNHLGYTKNTIRLILLTIILFQMVDLARAEVGFQLTPGDWDSPHAVYYQQQAGNNGLSLQPSPIFTGRRSPVTWKYTFDLAANTVYYEATVFGSTILTSGTLSIAEFLTYHQTKSLRAEFLKSAQRVSTGASQGSGQDGFIPDIVVPVEMPKVIRNIFGEGEPRLNISGQQRISFEGRSSWTPGGTTTFENTSQSLFPQLKMEQQLTVRLDGTIGDKMHVLVDHNSQAYSGNKNKIRLRYEGYEDDIIKLIEAGDTNLSLSGGGLVSGSIPHKGLFGMKMEAQLGGVELTMIASKEEGKMNTSQFIGTGTQDSLARWDYEYVKRQFFWIADPKAMFTFGENNQIFVNGNMLPDGFVYVYLDDNQVNENDGLGQPGIAVAQSVATPEDSVYNSAFNLLTPGQTSAEGDYYLDNDQGFIYFFRPISDNATLAIAYQDRTGEWHGGDVTTNPDTLRLKLIRPKNMQPYSHCWDYELRNVYHLGNDVDYNSLNIRLLRYQSGAGLDDIPINPENSPHTFLNLIGLDSEEDGFVDQAYLNVIPNYLWLPHFPPDYYPFELPVLDASDQLNPHIYEVAEGQIYPEQPGNKKFYFAITYSKPRRQISLNQLNIIEGSVRVRRNGEMLTEGQDYTVNYDFGQVNLNQTLGATDRIEIDYEYAGMAGFASSQKTLMGIRADYDYGDHISLGSTWMYEGEKAIEERPRLGEEATRKLVGGFDGRVQIEPPLLTDMVNVLPFVDTEVKSSVSFTAEGAISIPNPNIKGDAYIDDMEGIVQSTSFGVSPSKSWRSMSQPKVIKEGLADTLAVTDFGKIKWFLPTQGPSMEDIFGELPDDQYSNNEQTVLEIHFSPHDSLQPGYENMPADSLAQSWAGIQKSISPAGHDFSRQSFLEVWLHSDMADSGRLVIDMGDISEDAVRRVGPNSEFILPPNGTKDTEDGLLTGVPDGELQINEDVGLDQFDGDDENYAECDHGLEECDDGNDDYPSQDEINSNRNNFELININGTEGNGYLDTEDLDFDGQLNLYNKYLQYTINLGDTTQANYYVPGTFHQHGETPTAGWRQYRIPLDAAIVDTIGVPDIYSVRFARIWLTGFTQPKDHVIQLYSIDVTGNRWLPEGITAADSAMSISPDEKFRVSSKNNKEHSSVYEKPPGIKLRKDTTGQSEREQTLVLEYENLAPGHSGKASQYFTSDQDLRDYRTLKCWVSYPQSYLDSLYAPEILPENGEEPEIFIRLGADTLNYYERRIKLNELAHTPDAGDKTKWYEIVIPLDSLTFAKNDPSANPDSADVSGRTYIYNGRPTLSRVKTISLGVRNTSSRTITGEVWVNEMRVSDVNRDIGWTARANLDVRLADVATFSYNLVRENDAYTPFSGTRRNANTTNHNLNGSLQLHKFLPPALGLSMPLRAHYKKTNTTPLYEFGSDVILTPDKQEAQKNVSEERGASVSLARSSRSNNPLMKILFDNLTLAADYSERNSFSATKEDTSVTYGGRMDYNLQFGQKDIRLYKRFAISLLPSNMTFGASINHNESRGVTKNNGVRTMSPEIFNRTGKGSFSMTYKPIPNLNTRFQMSEDRDMSQDGATSLGSLNLGLRSSHSKRVEGSYNINLFGLLNPKFTGNIDYSERHMTRQNQSAGTPNMTTGATVSRNVNYGADLSVQPEKVFGIVGSILSVGKVFTRLVPGGGSPDQGDPADSPPEGTRDEKPDPPPKGAEKPADNTGDKSDPVVLDPMNPDDAEINVKDRPPVNPLLRKPDRKTDDPGPDPTKGEKSEPPENRPEHGPKKGRTGRQRSEERGEGDGGGIFGTVGSVFSTVFDGLGTISGRYNKQKQLAYNNLEETPGFDFQFGFEDAISDSITPAFAQSKTDRDDYSLSTRYDLFNRVSFDIRYAYNHNEQLTNGTSGYKTETRDKFEGLWPNNISCTVNAVEKLPIFNKLVNRASLSSTFKKTIRESGRGSANDDIFDPDSSLVDTRTTNTDLSPLVSLSMDTHFGMKLNLSANYNKSYSEQTLLTNPKHSLTTKTSFSSNMEYTLKSGRGGRVLPIFGRINSDVRLSLQLQYSMEEAYRGVDIVEYPDIGDYPEMDSDKRTISVRPAVSYTFSQSVTGGLQGEYSSSTDKASANSYANRRSVGLNIWTQLKF